MMTVLPTTTIFVQRRRRRNCIPIVGGVTISTLILCNYILVVHINHESSTTIRLDDRLIRTEDYITNSSSTTTTNYRQLRQLWIDDRQNQQQQLQQQQQPIQQQQQQVQQQYQSNQQHEQNQQQQVQNPIQSSQIYEKDSTTTTNIDNNEIQQQIKCYNQYKLWKRHPFIQGLTKQDFITSRAYYGNTRRLQLVRNKIQQQQSPVNIIVAGGSITLAHGLRNSPRYGYGKLFERWLNSNFPVNNTNNNLQQNHPQVQHDVHINAAHGADICAMAKRLHFLMDDIPNDPDLFILEFAVNDYQGQDHTIHIDHKTEVFFDGFQQMAICAEAVVHTLVTTYPNAAIVFLEFRTAILKRKTAQLLHTGVAQHYQIPIISYADTMYPFYYNLLSQLDPNQSYTVPIGETIQPYPHGCYEEWNTTLIEPVFHKHGCQASVCNFMWLSGQWSLDCKNPAIIPPNRTHCYVPFFAHDEIHPSFIGHQIAVDLLIEAFARTAQDTCLSSSSSSQSLEFNNNTTTTTTTTTSSGNNDGGYYKLPKEFGFMTSADDIGKYTNFIIVKDTMEMFGPQIELVPSDRSTGFQYYGDGIGKREGWICTNTTGGEYITFTIELPPSDTCYVVYLAVLKSYEGMGNFTIELHDHTSNTITTKDIQGIWKPRISVPSDIQINTDTDTACCSGNCSVTVRTHTMQEPIQEQLLQSSSSSNNNNKKKPFKIGNKVKIMSLSVRKSIPPRQYSTNDVITDGLSWLNL